MNPSAILGLTEDGRILLSSGPRLWNANDGSLLREIAAKDNIPNAAISLNGERVAVVDVSRLRIFEVKTGNELATFDLELGAGPSASAWQVQFSPDGNRLLVESFGSMKVWNGTPP